MSVIVSEPEAMPRVDVAAAPREKTLRAAVIGAGYIAGYHLDVLRRLSGVEVVGACDPHLGRLDALCDQHRIPHRARSLPALLEVCQPDVVHVLVPPPFHGSVASEALRSGLNVLVEKPMTLDVAEAGELIEVAREHGVHLGVNHNAVFHPAFRKLLRDVENHKLGRVEHVISLNNLPLAQLESGEHDHWMFRDPANVLFEQAPHPLSQIVALLGPVLDVQTSVSDTKVLRAGNTFHSAWQMSLKCARGTAQLFQSFGRSFPDARLHVVGQDGVADVDLINNVYLLDRRTKYIEPVDYFFRGVRRSWSAMWQAFAGFGRYALSTLRLLGRRDPFYVSMKGSIEAFYRRVRGEDDTWDSAQNGHHVVEGLAQAAASFPKSTPPRMIASAESRDGDVLVLGGTGFIGRHLVRALADAGHSVRLMARRAALAPVLPSGRPAVMPGDIRNPDDVRRAVAGCKAVIHLVSGAPNTWPEFEQLFVGGTRIVAEAVLDAKTPQLLFASSIAAYYLGKRSQVITEESPIDPKARKRSHYTLAKVECEKLLLELHRTRGIPVTIFRPGVVVGPGGLVEHSGVGWWPTPAHCISWSRSVGHPLPFVLVEDVANAFVRAVGRNDLAGQSFNLVGDVPLSAAEYVDALRTAIGRDVRLHRQSVLWWWLVDVFKWCVKAAARRSGNVFPSWRDLASRSLKSPFDCSKAKRMLGWQPVADRHEFLVRAIRQVVTGGGEA